MSLVLAGNTSGQTTLQATDAVTATITLPSATDTLVGKITPSFTTTIGVGAATPSTSGAGITFPATQSASTDANTLDDYEEGSFTPTIIGVSTAGTGTYTIQVGRYAKVGANVTFTLNLTWTAHTGTGAMRITGLPFGTLNATNVYPTWVIMADALSLTASNFPICNGDINSTLIYLAQTPTGGGAQTTIPMDTAGQIIISGSYISN